MPRLPALHRRAVALGLVLATLSLAGCGQIGKLFLRMPDVEFPPQAPLIVGELTPIFLPAGVTLPAPVSATRPVATAATPAAPAAATRMPPTAATSKPPAAATTHP
ncbi:MAG TPA: hypothetical protein VH327_00355 [Gammaproteobacteria bacterium]|jgi:hypothetical protein|nr:hypothetical protein [Gammaproteobacteria bacterium]